MRGTRFCGRADGEVGGASGGRAPGKAQCATAGRPKRVSVHAGGAERAAARRAAKRLRSRKARDARRRPMSTPRTQDLNHYTSVRRRTTAQTARHVTTARSSRSWGYIQCVQHMGAMGGALFPQRENGDSRCNFHAVCTACASCDVYASEREVSLP